MFDNYLTSFVETKFASIWKKKPRGFWEVSKVSGDFADDMISAMKKYNDDK